MPFPKNDDLDIAINSIDLAVEHPDLINGIEPTEILEHSGSTEPLEEVAEIVSEHPKIVINAAESCIEPTDVLLEHPKVITELSNINIDPSDIVLEHPQITPTTDIDIEPEDIALEHIRAAVGPKCINIEPTDIAIEHPKVASDYLDIEPSYVALEHPRSANPIDLDLEPNELVLEHPKIVKRFYPIYVEPNFIATEHPKVLKKSEDFAVEPTEIALEHPKIVKERFTNVEPSDIVEEHPDLVGISTENHSFPINHQQQASKTQSKMDNSASESINDFIKRKAKESTTERNTEFKKGSEPKSTFEEKNPNFNTFDFMNSKQFRAAAKMAEEQTKQPGMDIDSVDVVPRMMWNAAEPTLKIPLDKPITAVLATYTGTKPCFDDTDCKRIIQNLQTTQMEEMNLPDIQWNFMIGGTGKVYEGRGVDTLATKPPHYDKEALDSLDIAYIGNNEEQELVPAMFAAFNGLVAWALDAGHVSKPFSYLQDSPQYRKVLKLQ